MRRTVVAVVAGALLAGATPGPSPDRDPSRLRPGLFLYSVPGLNETRFSETVVLLVEHGLEGSMGLVVNRPTGDPLGEALPGLVEAVIKGWQGSDERQKIRERTMRGKSAKAKAGKVVGEGVAPFGYSYHDGGFVINEQQAKVIRMIFNWYVNGDENRHMMGFVAIAERLTQTGIASPLNAKGILRYHGKAIGWGSNTIRRIIISETYCGVWQWGKRTRAKEDQIPVTVPAIISRELWDLAQERRIHNSRFSRRRMKRDYLLRGLVYCGCGHGMVGSGRGKYYYYYCSRKYGSGVSIGTEVCYAPIIRGYKLEYIAWWYILRLLTNAQEFESKLREAQELEAEQMQPKQRELESVLSLLEQTEREAEEAATALSQVKGIVGKKLQIQADELDRRYQALLARKEKLESELEN